MKFSTLLMGLGVSMLLSSLSCEAKAGVRGVRPFEEPRHRHLGGTMGSSTCDDEDYTYLPGDCVYCSKCNKDNKPTSLMLQYVPDQFATSRFGNKGTCDGSQSYPGSTTLQTFDKDGNLIETFNDVTQDTTISVTLPSSGADTLFQFSASDSLSTNPCSIHTSCSQPLVAGDIIGPFLILDDGNCNSPLGPSGPCEDGCTICDSDNKNKPTKLTFRFESNGANSMYQTEDKASCRAGFYPTGTVTAEDKAGNELSWDLSDGEDFFMESADGFNANTEFTFSDGSRCSIHTSCSVPIVTGDKIGPFVVLGGNECAVCTPSPTESPTPAPTPSPTPSPTARPTPAPTPNPTAGPTAGPTPSPTSSPTPTPTPAPTPNPTAGPTAGPTPSPTAGPTPGPTPDPTAGPTAGPTPPPTSAPTPQPTPEPPCCEVLASYENEVITVDFRNVCTGDDQQMEDSRAREDDFVGLYPCDYEVDTDHASTTWLPRPDFEPGAWLYTCFSANDNATCQIGPTDVYTEGQLVFQWSTAPDYALSGQNVNLDANGRANYNSSTGEWIPGCYVAFLSHINGESAPPYYVACKSLNFTVPA